MTRRAGLGGSAALLLVALVATSCSGEPDVQFIDIPVSLIDPTPPQPACPESAFRELRSVLIEVRRPIGTNASCVLRETCVDIDAQTLRSRPELQERLQEEGRLFDDIAHYGTVMLRMRGLLSESCEVADAEDPTFCGRGNQAEISPGTEAEFTVEISCNETFVSCGPAPPCAGADL